VCISNGNIVKMITLKVNTQPIKFLFTQHINNQSIMKKELNYVEQIGYCLFFLMMLPLLLLLMAEPNMANDEPQTHLSEWIVYGWLAVTSFSVLLIIIGRRINNTHKIN